MTKIISLVILLAASFPLAYSQSASLSGGRLQKGYRGFVETGGGASVTDYDLKNIGFFFLNTTHGYQFSEWLFAGGGAGYLYFEDDYYSRHPHHFEYYGDVRFTIPTQSKFYPFADLKLGGATGGSPTLKVSCELGSRYAINEDLGLSLGFYCNYLPWLYGFPIVGASVGFDF